VLTFTAIVCRRSTLSFHNGVEFAVADDASGLWTRGALPKGTTRK